MSKVNLWLASLAVGLFAVGLTGCPTVPEPGGTPSDTTSSTEQGEDGHDHEAGDAHDHEAGDAHDHEGGDAHDEEAGDAHDHEAGDGHDHEAGDADDHGMGDMGGMGGPSTKVKEALANLSPEDRAAAEKQKTCPVSDEPLGAMGTPCKVTVKGRDVFLCCAGCKKAVTDDPDKFLAKLDK